MLAQEGLAQVSRGVSVNEAVVASGTLHQWRPPVVAELLEAGRTRTMQGDAPGKPEGQGVQSCGKAGEPGWLAKFEHRLVARR